MTDLPGIGSPVTATIYLHDPPDITVRDLRPFLRRERVHGYLDWVLNPGSLLTAEHAERVTTNYYRWRSDWARDVILGDVDTVNALWTYLSTFNSRYSQWSATTSIDPADAALLTDTIDSLNLNSAADTVVEFHSPYRRVRTWTEQTVSRLSTEAETVTLSPRGLTYESTAVSAIMFNPDPHLATILTTVDGHRHPISHAASMWLHSALVTSSTGHVDAAVLTGTPITVRTVTWAESMVTENVYDAAHYAIDTIKTLHLHIPV